MTVQTVRPFNVEARAQPEGANSCGCCSCGWKCYLIAIGFPTAVGGTIGMLMSNQSYPPSTGATISMVIILLGAGMVSIPCIQEICEEEEIGLLSTIRSVVSCASKIFNCCASRNAEAPLPPLALDRHDVP